MNRPPEMPQAAVDLRTALAAYAEELRRHHRERLDRPVVYVLHPNDYEALARAVAEGLAPAWMAAEFARGTYTPHQPVSPDGER